MTHNHNFLNTSKIFNFFKLCKRFLFPKQQFWSKALLCWIISCLVLTLDSTENYDYRFKLRDNTNLSPEIITLLIDRKELMLLGSKDNLLKEYSPESFNEFYNLSDNHYWDKTGWAKLIGLLLKEDPKKIGILFDFNSLFKTEFFSKNQSSILFNPKVTWGNLRGNSMNIFLDDDGFVRRIKKSESGLKTFPEDFLNKALSKRTLTSTINYKSRTSSHSITLKEFLNKASHLNLKDKYILIGADNSSNHTSYYTPIGSMSKIALWNNITDNMLEDAFIKKLPFFIYAAALLLLLILCIFVIQKYPYTVALFFFIWIATLWSAFSVWVFDTFYIWIPITSPVILLISIWIAYIGHHAIALEQTNFRLLQEQRYLEELERLKNNFVSLISHDLKTPIAKIQSVVDRQLAFAEHTPELTSDLENLKSYSMELNKYIQSILKLLRVESRDVKLFKETADINNVIENVIQRLSPLAQEKNIHIDLFLEPIFLIEFDVNLMTEVILNLVENAIKFSSENSKIWIKTSESESFVLIEVGDSGPGILPEDQDRIWNKFARGKDQDLKTKGSGLGLYLVKYFIELHDGSITLKSEKDKGTRFYIRLPID